MPEARRRSRITLALTGIALGLFVAGCSSTVGQGATPGRSSAPPSPGGVVIVWLPPDTPVPPATPTAIPTATATPSPSPSPSPTPPPTRTPQASRPPARSAGPVRTGTASAPPSGSLVGLPTFSDTAAATSVVHYSITGSTERALIAGMETNVPSTCDAHALACFVYRFAWTYTTQTSGSVCAVTSVNLSRTYTMVLPQWTAPALVPSRLAAWWRKVHDHILWHETQHLTIANAFMPTLQAGIKAGPCDSTGSQQKADALLAQLKSQQDAFDASDSGWTWPAY